MQTAGEELWFDIEGRGGGLEHDEEFLQEAESACLHYRVVGRGPADDAPGDGVRDLPAVEVPHVSAHSFPVRFNIFLYFDGLSNIIAISILFRLGLIKII